MELLFFYDKYSPESLKSKSAVSKIITQKRKKNIRIRNIEISGMRSVCKKYNVMGIPTLVLLRKQKPVLKLLGQMTEDELNRIIDQYCSPAVRLNQKKAIWFKMNSNLKRSTK
ncbi:MAG: hypothetical protein CVV24_10260 [Ignavibacteriae bacterium HGW-Ignavibacteriae-3]|nr:MAG: hypothetical protein CVV24_10260 [Ignavibacteriae bacterium HGW-Ignavibacteriae-3]